MSARKTEDLFSPSATTSLSLSSGAIHVRKNGIEFRADNPLPLWSEMTVTLQPPGSEKKIQCSGVVVACNGNRHTGYAVSLLFTHITKQSQEALQHMASARV